MTTKREKIFRFESEAAMCAAFIRDAKRQGWTAYPETGGFDIILLHDKTKLQIGVQAKQCLNAAVVGQIISAARELPERGPDFLAVLVPEGGAEGLNVVLGMVGVTTIRAKGEPNASSLFYNKTEKYSTLAFQPPLPTEFDLELLAKSDDYWWERTQWPQHCPAQQCKLPDYVPDVAAGSASPIALTEWKVRAIKIAVLLERRGVVTAEDFKALKISMSRWTQTGWIKSVRRGVWQAGGLPNFRAQHPINFDQIAADFETWSAALPKPPADLFQAA